MTVLTPAGVVVCPATASRSVWLKARKAGLGASDTAAVLGLSPWTTPLDVWLDKRTPEVSELESEAAEWGSAHEATIARKVNQRHRDQIGHVRPSPGLLRHDDHHWMLATPDRLLTALPPASGPGGDQIADSLLEVKTAGHRQRDKWDNGPPSYYLIQVQQQLAVTGLPHGWISVLHGGNYMPPPYRVERDERVIEQIVAYAGDWWQKHVVAGVAPEPTWPADESNLTRLWSGDPEARYEVTDDDDLPEWLRQYRAAKQREKEAKDRAGELAFRIKARLRDATEAWHGETPLATLRPYERRDIDAKRLREELPDVAEAYTRTTTVRPLRLKGESNA